MKTSQLSVCLRATTVALVATLAVLSLAVVLGPSIDLNPAQPFADLLSQWCSLVLLGCAGWAWLVTGLVLLEALRSARGIALAPRRRGIPATYRRLVLTTCGLALAAGTAGPALATPGPVHLDPRPAAAAPSVHSTRQQGTPVIQARAPIHLTPASRQRRAASAGTDIVVQHGDSLWTLAAERLAANADDAVVAHAWQRLYAANTAIIGADPDHIEPGQRLMRPRGW